MNGTQYYTIIDLPIDVTNSISNTTQHSSSQARPFCALRNNPLLSPAQINSSTTLLPFQPFLGGNVSVPGSGSGSGSGSGVGTTTSTSSTPTSTRLSATAAGASTSVAAHSGGGLSGTKLAIVLGCVLGALALGLLALFSVLCCWRRCRSRNGSPRLLSPDDKTIESWRNRKNRHRSRNGLALNPPD
jgi:hypothetical protein